MPLAFDVEIQAAIIEWASSAAPESVPARGDWAELRRVVNDRLMAVSRASDPFLTVCRTAYSAAANDGSSIQLRWFEKRGSRPGPAVLYLHGGGMICGTLEMYDPWIAAMVEASSVSMLAVDYRLAPEFPGTHPVEDCYLGLAWLVKHAAEWGVDPKRIAVMGDSAGGGLAAGVALLARDRGIPVAKQILIYPMLDDRNIVPDPELVPFATWTYDNNYTGWSALLGDALGTDEVPYGAAPARAVDLRGVAPAYVEVGNLDIFRDEDIEYARRLAACGIPLELHVHPGAPHAFEVIAPASDLARRSTADRLRVLASL